MKSLLLLLLTLFSLGCTSEKEDVTWWSNQERIIELQGQLDLANFRAAEINANASDPSNEIRVIAPKVLELEIDALQSRRERISAEISEMYENWEAFRLSILAERRNEAIGKSYENFETSQGHHYRSATVTNIDDTGVSIRHSSGTARLRCEDLSEEEQIYFGLDRKLSVVALQTERDSRAAYENWVGKNLVVAEKKAAELARERKREEQQAAQSARMLALAARTTKSSAFSSSFGKLGDTTRVYGSYRRSSYRSYYHRPRNRYVNYHPRYNHFPTHCIPRNPHSYRSNRTDIFASGNPFSQ